MATQDENEGIKSILVSILIIAIMILVAVSLTVDPSKGASVAWSFVKGALFFVILGVVIAMIAK